MSANHPLRCNCGTLQGYVSEPDSGTRAVCYCRDCQAFAHFLGRAGEILDDNGGTEIVATAPGKVTFTQGQHALACMSLSPKGLLRWYASCCNTPIGNTSRNLRVCYVGLVHNALIGAAPDLASAFGPIRMRVNTAAARSQPPSMRLSNLAVILRLMGSLLHARLTGSYQLTPFFDPHTGAPVVSPKVLTRSEREACTPKQQKR